MTPSLQRRFVLINALKLTNCFHQIESGSGSNDENLDAFLARRLIIKEKMHAVKSENEKAAVLVLAWILEYPCEPLPDILDGSESVFQEGLLKITAMKASILQQAFKRYVSKMIFS